MVGGIAAMALANHERLKLRIEALEKRLARMLLLLAHYGEPGRPQKALRKVSQEMLAEMIGATRPRVNFFMNKFRRLGFIKYNGGLQINTSLLTVVLHE